MNPAELGSSAVRQSSANRIATLEQNANTNTPVGCWYEFGSSAYIGVCRTAELPNWPFSPISASFRHSADHPRTDGRTEVQRD